MKKKDKTPQETRRSNLKTKPRFTSQESALIQKYGSSEKSSQKQSSKAIGQR